MPGVESDAVCRRPLMPPGRPRAWPRTEDCKTMDIEHINALGTQIADLTQRTAELRRYL